MLRDKTMVVIEGGVTREYYADRVHDTVRMVENWAGMLLVRHHQKGMTAEVVYFTQVPIVNASDERSEHPTQS